MEFVDLISNVGFPIACVIACGVYIHNTTKQNRDDNQRREEKFYQQIDKFGDTLNNFNATLIRIDTRLEALEKKVD